MSDFSRLRDIIAEHEVFWAGVAQRHPGSPEMRWFITSQWDPLYAQWIDLVANHGLSNSDGDWLTEFLLRLNGLRGVAQAHGIPIPRSEHGTVIVMR